VRRLLNVAGQSFIISGFVLFVLAVPLYYTYPPLYTGMEEHANNLMFLSSLGLGWTLFGIYPMLLSVAMGGINIGDLVRWDREVIIESEPQPMSIGIVVDKMDDVPIGWFNEDGERETVSKYKVFWQDLQGCGWHWEEDISRYEDTNRGEQ
tara:strand:- start:1140 stop:1592 length:453 start_codon:yes stop_codon:yes gene_type:complete